MLHSERMSRRPSVLLPRVRPLLGGLAVALVTLAQAQAAAGACGSIFRAIVLSWDNPATQVVDELASESVPHADPGRQAREQVARAGGADARLALAEHPAIAVGQRGGARITRSPPLV